MAILKLDAFNRCCITFWLGASVLLNPANGGDLHPYIERIIEGVGNADSLGVKISSPYPDRVNYSFQTKMHKRKIDFKGPIIANRLEYEGPAIDGFLVLISIRPLYGLPYLSNKNGISSSGVEINTNWFRRTTGYELDSCMVVVTIEEGFLANQNKVHVIEEKINTAIVGMGLLNGIYHKPVRKGS